MWKLVIATRSRKQSFLPRETLLSWSRVNKTEIVVNRRTVVNINGCIIVYTQGIVYELSLGYFAAVPFVFALFLREFIVNGNSDSAINDRCADLLRVLSLLLS